MRHEREYYVWAVLRLCMGWTFFWPFLDKLFGFGFSTPSGKGWLDGGSPTLGFLKMAAKGPFADFYHSLAGVPLVDWLFMIGLCCIGLALIFGVGVKIAGWSGALLLVLMYTAGFMPPVQNPFLDEHLIFAVLMIGLATTPSGHVWGLGEWWSNTRLVEKYPWLQ